MVDDNLKPYGAKTINAPVVPHKFAVLSSDSVAAYGETIGIVNLKPSVSGIIAEDLSYRLRHLVHVANNFTKHSKRRKLTVSDINSAISTFSSRKIFGYSSASAPLVFSHIPDEDLHIVDSADVNLLSAATQRLTLSSSIGVTLSSRWVTLAGSSQQNWPSELPTSDQLEPIYTEYYLTITRAVLGSDLVLKQTALRSLRTNSHVQPVLPYFVNFISHGVQRVSHDTLQLRSLLDSTQALLANKALFLEPRPYIGTLTNSLLYCITKPLSATIKTYDDHWSIRSYAARLLVLMFRLWPEVSSKQISTTKEVCLSALTGLKQPLSLSGSGIGASHFTPGFLLYGALITLREISAEAFASAVFANCDHICESLLHDERPMLDVLNVSHALLIGILQLLRSVKSEEDSCKHYLVNASFLQLFSFLSNVNDIDPLNLSSNVQSISQIPESWLQSRKKVSLFTEADESSGKDLLHDIVFDRPKVSPRIISPVGSKSLLKPASQNLNIAVKATETNAGIKLKISVKRPRKLSQTDNVPNRSLKKTRVDPLSALKRTTSGSALTDVFNDLFDMVPLEVHFSFRVAGVEQQSSYSRKFRTRVIYFHDNGSALSQNMTTACTCRKVVKNSGLKRHLWASAYLHNLIL